MSDGGQTVPRITKAEHIGPDDTGDNIEAKRVAAYGWDGSNWQRQGLQLTPGKDYDYTAITYVSGGNGAGEISTVTYKIGGSGGTTVQTITLAYNSDDELESVTYS